MDDFEYQLDFVIDASWRMAGFQDKTPLSPSYGCFHYAYWRDKTSEFADARFQEAGAALGLLSLPQFDEARRNGRIALAADLYKSFSIALYAWSNNQHSEGCWDEWYKGERGFAATEFSMIAFGLAARYLGHCIKAEDRKRLVTTVRKAADWLTPRHDRIKSNHEAAAAAALSLARDVTGDERYGTAAAEKIADLLRRQQPEGWFPEVGGMDLGYCSVLLDYVMIYVLVSGDDSPIPAMRRLLEFMVPHIHPDCTISPEAGLCLNPYVSRLGIGLLSAQGDENAAALISTLTTESPGRAGLAAYLADDLRLCRWSYLPIVTSLEQNSFKSRTGDGNAFFQRLPHGWTVNHESAIAAFHDDCSHVYASAAGGGAVRIYAGCDLVCEDLGIDVLAPSGMRGSTGYSRERQITQVPDGIVFTCELECPKFVYPGFWSRLVLRLGSLTPISARVLRNVIDLYRLKKGTSINQSAAPIAGNSNGFRFKRSVLVDEGAVSITDQVMSDSGRIDTRWIRLNLQVRDDSLQEIGEELHSDVITIAKTFSRKGDNLAFSMKVTDKQI